MARWSGDREQWIFGDGGRYEEERRRAGGWRGGGRDWEDRDRERWSGGEPRGEEWRGASRGEEWREREPERWTSGGEYGRGGIRGGEWEREDRSGRYGEGRQGEQRGRSYGEGLRGGREMGESGSSYGSGGTYGGTGGMYGGSMGEGTGGMRRPGSGYGVGEYGGYGHGESGYGGRERGGEWRGGWRDTSRDFARDLRGRGEEEGPFERMGDRVREGWRKLTGRGPKGYKRSDERIREDVSERIARSGVNAEDVEVKVEKGEVTLTGFVDGRDEKRMIEDIADDVFGVDEVNNHLRVRREEQRQTFGAGASQTAQATGQRTSQGTQPQPGRH